MKKGISTVIATILMLIITIALAGTAYMYMTMTLTGKIAVVLSEFGEGSCTAGGTADAITLYIRNDGTSASGALTWANVANNPSAITACTFNPTTLSAGTTSTVTCTRTSAGTGLWKVRISAPGANAVTPGVYCSS